MWLCGVLFDCVVLLDFVCVCDMGAFVMGIVFEEWLVFCEVDVGAWEGLLCVVIVVRFLE